MLLLKVNLWSIIFPGYKLQNILVYRLSELNHEVMRQTSKYYICFIQTYNDFEFQFYNELIFNLLALGLFRDNNMSLQA